MMIITILIVVLILILTTIILITIITIMINIISIIVDTTTTTTTTTTTVVVVVVVIIIIIIIIMMSLSSPLLLKPELPLHTNYATFEAVSVPVLIKSLETMHNAWYFPNCGYQVILHFATKLTLITVLIFHNLFLNSHPLQISEFNPVGK